MEGYVYTIYTRWVLKWYSYMYTQWLYIMTACVQDGQTALYIASQKGHGPVVELLLQTEHTDVNVSTKVWHAHFIRSTSPTAHTTCYCVRPLYLHVYIQLKVMRLVKWLYTMSYNCNQVNSGKNTGIDRVRSNGSLLKCATFELAISRLMFGHSMHMCIVNCR